RLRRLERGSEAPLRRRRRLRPYPSTRPTTMIRQAGRRAWRTPSPLAGLSLSLGFTLAYLSLFVLIPLTALAIRPWENGFDSVIAAVASPRAQAALRLSFIAAAVAAAVNAIMGGLLA